MPANVYSEIFLHITWHTKDSLPVLRGDVRDRVYAYLRNRVIQTPGVYFYEIGGIEDHIHMAVRIPPNLLISDWVGKLKGSSTHHANHPGGHRSPVMQWQDGYGVVSFGHKDLPWVIEYIRNQAEHHTKEQVHARLECVNADEAKAG